MQDDLAIHVRQRLTGGLDADEHRLSRQEAAIGHLVGLGDARIASQKCQVPRILWVASRRRLPLQIGGFCALFANDIAEARKPDIHDIEILADETGHGVHPLMFSKAARTRATASALLKETSTPTARRISACRSICCGSASVPHIWATKAGAPFPPAAARAFSMAGASTPAGFSWAP